MVFFDEKNKSSSFLQAHVVSAFEQSLSSMTQRLQHLTATTEKKDQELLELRKNIELLRKQSKDMQNTSSNLPPGTPCLPRRHAVNNDEITSNGKKGNRESKESISFMTSVSRSFSRIISFQVLHP